MRPLTNLPTRTNENSATVDRQGAPLPSRTRPIEATVPCHGSAVDIVDGHNQRDQQGSGPSQIYAPPQNPEPVRGGIAPHIGIFGTPWIPRLDNGSAQGPSAAQASRPNLARDQQSGRISRQANTPALSHQGSTTDRKGSAFENTAPLSQRAGTPQGGGIQHNRLPPLQLQPQDARCYSTQSTPDGGAQGLGINLGAQAARTKRGRGSAREIAGSGGSLFRLHGNVKAGRGHAGSTGGSWGGLSESRGNGEGGRGKGGDVAGAWGGVGGRGRFPVCG